MENTKPSVWRAKFRTLKEYYRQGFNTEYYHFDALEMTIDPDETIDQINEYDKERQHQEIVKCAISFAYFATKYVKILHPKKGLVPFVLYKYQQDVIEAYEQHRFNIIRKFRQGGLTTVTEIWGLWRCLFKTDEQILFLSKTDSEAIAAGEIVNTAAKNLPTWMFVAKADGKWNDHKKEFPETGGKMHFGTPERARGLAITYLILDEAAFIPEMDRHWKSMYPTLSTGGSCIVISTVNGIGNWYEETYHAAKNKTNAFHIIDLEYTQHPDYNNPLWVKEQKSQLGQKGWDQEVLGSFLNSGETYIPSHIIGELQKLTRNNEPIRKTLKNWINQNEIAENTDEFNEQGALWIWKEPAAGREYIFGCDASEGVGNEGDNSCIQILDQSTLEQVGEFYSNNIQPYFFAQIIYKLGLYYNHALVVVENMGPGGAVLSHLQNEMAYENLHYEAPVGRSAKTLKPGIKVSPTNRPLILEGMQNRLMNGTIRINSRRLVKEITTFTCNPQTQKIQATKGKHDDAIMALCIALYVRDSSMRDAPMGAEIPMEMNSPLKSSIYAEIEKEIMAGAPENFFADKTAKKSYIDDGDDMLTGVILNYKRKNDGILKLFGW